MYTLALQAANDTVTDVDRATIQKEVDQLKDQIDDNAFQSTFNGLYPLVPMDGIVTFKEITKPADIVFLVDTTGSMSSPISSVRSSLSTFADALKAAGVDFRFGLISYGDVSEASTVSDDVEKYDLGTDGFTTDVEVLKDALGKLKVRGGGDFPESGLEAIMDPTNGALTYSFRPDASKQLIVVTDATFHTKADGWSAYDIPETVEAMKAAGVTLTGVVSPGAAERQWDMLVKDTGGTTFAAISGDFSRTLEDYAEALLKSLSGDGGEVEQRLYIQTGTKANQNLMMKITDARAKAIGVSDVKVSPFEEAMKAIGTVTDALNRILDDATRWGSYSQRLDACYENITTSHENTLASESTIADADMAKEMTDYVKSNILSQSAQAMLAQSNQNLGKVLNLLQ